MFLRFDEVRSSGEQHDVVVVFVPPACVAVVGVVVDCVGGGGSRGAGSAKRR